MKLRRDLLISIGSLVALNLLVGLGTVALLSRMGPAIAHILQANATSVEDAERMLRILAMTGGQPATEVQRLQFVESLERVEGNLTESGEQPVVDRIRAEHAAALGGDIAATAAAVAALEDLVGVNRAAMRAEDRKAQRMVKAGAWSVVFIAVIGFGASLLVIRRLRRMLVEPLAELYATLEAAGKGDRFRRCTSGDAPHELKRIFQIVNQMLDQQERRRGHGSEGSARMALLHLLEQQPRPVFVVDGSGALVAANRLGLEQLESEQGASLRVRLAHVPVGGSKRIDAVQLGDGETWYCELAHPHVRVESEADLGPASAGDRPA